MGDEAKRYVVKFDVGDGMPYMRKRAWPWTARQRDAEKFASYAEAEAYCGSRGYTLGMGDQLRILRLRPRVAK